MLTPEQRRLLKLGGDGEPSKARKSRAVVKLTSRKWIGGVVPYELSVTLSKQHNQNESLEHN